MAQLFSWPVSSDLDMSSYGDEVGNITENIHSKSPKKTSWVDHILRPGVDPTTVQFFIIGTHKNDKSCLPHVLVGQERMFHANVTNRACTDIHIAFCFFSWSS
jgi:hypothetical protein